MTRTTSPKAQARWRYYGQLGSLCMTRTILRTIAKEYFCDNDLVHTCLIADNAICAVRAAVIKHESDWRGMK